MSRRTLTVFGTLIAVVLSGVIIKMVVMFDAERFLSQRRAQLFGMAQTGQPATGFGWERLGEIGQRFHQGEGECLRYGVDPASLATNDYAGVLRDLATSGLLEHVDNFILIWSVWGIDDERQRHGPVTSREIREVLCLSSSLFECLLARLNADRLGAVVEEQVEVILARLRNEIEGPLSRLSGEERKQLREVWKRHKIMLSSPAVAVRLLEPWRPTVTRRRAEKAAATVLAWAAENRRLPKRIDEVFTQDDRVPKDAWGVDLELETAEGVIRLFSRGDDQQEGGEGYAADIVVERPFAGGEGAGPVSSVGDQLVNRAEYLKAAGGARGIMGTVRMVPAFRGGESYGFKLIDIKPRSVWTFLRLENNVVITHHEGKPLTDPLAGQAFMQALTDPPERMTLRLERDGVASEQGYRFIR